MKWRFVWLLVNCLQFMSIDWQSVRRYIEMSVVLGRETGEIVLHGGGSYGLSS